MCVCVCVAGRAVLQDGELVVGVPGAVNWRGALFKNALFGGGAQSRDFNFDVDWYHSAVDDQSPLHPARPTPVTTYYSYLGNSLTVTPMHTRRRLLLLPR